jgi:DNA adenine methylase
MVLNIPGGKTRAINVLEQFVPANTSTIYSPFFGGGAFEMYCAKHKGIRIIASDKFKPLVNFWQCMLTNKCRVIEGIRNLLPMTKQAFDDCKAQYRNTKSKYTQAAMFYSINRVSFNGVMAKYSHVRAMRSATNILRKLAMFDAKDISISHQDYTTMLRNLPKSKQGLLLFLDPPYKLKEYYYGWHGEMHKGFDHHALAEWLLAIAQTVPWMLCYNDCDEIRTLYKGCAIYDVSWFHSMSFSNKKQENLPQNNSEIVILSHKLQGLLNALSVEVSGNFCVYSSE